MTHLNVMASLVLITCLSATPVYSTVLRVNKNAPGASQDGLSWATAFLTVQAAVDAASSGDEVWVARPDPAAAAYQEHITLKSGVTLLGGFLGTETTRFFRSPTINVTTLRGSDNPVVSVPDTVTGTATVDGFTITNGLSSIGGGVQVIGGALNLTGNIVNGNRSYSDGGGVTYTSGARGIVANNLFHTNTASYTGAGIHCYSADVSILNNTFVGNSIGGFGVNYGGGMSIVSSTAVVRGNLVFGNSSGVYSYTSTLTITNNNVFGNVDSSSVPLDYQNIPDATGSGGNIQADPLLSGVPAGNYRLTAGSPCIDAGDDAVLPILPIDLDGKNRKTGPHVDIGAYEYAAPVAAFTRSDLDRAIQIHRGDVAATPADLVRLNVNNTPPSDGRIDLIDVVQIVRKLFGLEPNP